MISDNYRFFNQPRDNKKNWIDNLALINFIILVFFTLFGTGLPFQEKSLDGFETETTNIVNQIVYSFLFLSSLPILLVCSEAIKYFILKERFLTLFLILCLLSALWSDYSFLSIKRSFQLVVMAIVLINAFLFLGLDQKLKWLRILIILYITVTYIAGFLIPGAIDTTFGTWRGLEEQKNGLGQMAVLLFLFSLFFYEKSDKRRKTIINYIISILSIILVLLSGSSTAALGLVVVLLLFLIFSFEKVFLPLKLGKSIFAILIAFITCIAILVSIFSQDLLAMIPGLFGKDLTLTGRTDIWEFVWAEIQKKLLLGYGYSTYWVAGTSGVETFRINQSHNSYLEIMLQLGLIGFVLFFILLAIFFKRIVKINHNLSLMTLISLLIINFTEGSLFQTRGRSTFVFLFFYFLVSVKFFELNNSSKRYSNYSE